MSCSQPGDTGRDEREFFSMLGGENRRRNDIGIRGVFVDDTVSAAVCFNGLTRPFWLV